MTAPKLRPGESWESGAMSAAECIAEVVERAGYSHLGTLAGRLPLREWLTERAARYDWPLVFRDGFTSANGPALVSATIDNQTWPCEQISCVFPLWRNA